MPQFWEETRAIPNMERNIVGNMRIDGAQLERYARAVIKFWHLVGVSPVD
jgi:hypothetical protein